jgi:pimeloyl-ACP methyl ester carboxylesterase
MAICRSVVAAAFIAIVAGLPGTARAQGGIPGCDADVLPAGALSLICVPAVGWNGALVVYAPGYAAFNEPLAIRNLTLPDGTFLPALVQSLGYAFATTSYRQNGLAILEGVEDLRHLIAAFVSGYSLPTRIHVAGVSEGGLVAALLAERSPQLVSSALATCGPIGSFQAQLDYFGDFRVLFDYFFPGVLPGSPVAIPTELIANWQSVYVPRVVAALAARPGRAVELMRTAKAAFDPARPETILNTTVNTLWYNVFGTNDAQAKLGGNPYGNRGKWYFGSSNDLLLNIFFVRRFSASPAARGAVRAYETSGDLGVPLVALHTTADEVVPFWHELLYLAKADPFDRGRFVPLPVFRYGHCNFTAGEVIGAFLVAVGLS